MNRVDIIVIIVLCICIILAYRIRIVEGRKMEENLNTLLKIKETELIKSFEANNMTLMFVKNQTELETYLKSILKDGK